MKNKIFLRALAGLLALVAVLPIVAACSENEEEQQTEPASSGEIALLEEPVVVADGAGVYFQVVRPEINTDVIGSCQSALVSLSKGVTLKFNVAKPADNPNGQCEILIGNTCREESVEAMNAIGYDDFSVTYKNNKIIIAAHNPERLMEATTFLKENLIKVNDGRVEFIGSYTFRSTEEVMIGEGESLSEYTIVCGDFDNLYGACSQLQQQIKKLCGVELEIAFDTQAKSGKEIVIGNAKREVSNRLEGLSMSEGLIAVDGDDLFIGAESITTTLLVFESFMEEHGRGTYTNTLNFKSGYEKTVNPYEKSFSDSPALAEGADVRIMSFNVLAELWGDKVAVSGRDEKVVSALIYYAPDVVGLQEMSPAWHTAMSPLLKGTPYKFIGKDNTVSHSTYGKTNFSPMLYNSDTLTLKESGVKAYSSASKTYAYVMTWAYFEHKETGKCFAVINTHFDLRNSGEKYDNNRTQQAKEIAAYVKTLQNRYSCEVITTGDYNTNESESQYTTIVNNGALHEAKYTADVIKRACNTYHKLGATISQSAANSIDHIFGTAGVRFAYFNVLVDRIVSDASDHCPIYADVILK